MRTKGMRWIWSTACWMLALSLAGSAWAQDAEELASEEGEEPEERLSPEGVGEEEPPDLVEARQRFQQGVALAEAGNCDAAVVEFNASYRLVPRPNTLYNIAQCQERLHRYDMALDTYRQYLEVAPPDDPSRPAVETAMRLLSNLLGTIHIRSNVQAEVWIDDRRMGDAPGAVPVPSGRHVVELRAEGHLPARGEVEVAGGQEAELELTLEPAQQQVTIHEHTTERVGISSISFWLTSGVALASAAVAAGLGGWALSLRNDVEAMDPRLRTNDDLAEIDDAALLSDIFWGVAGGFAIAAVVLAFLTDWGGGDDQAAEGELPSSALRVVPLATVGGLGMTMGGVW